MNNRRIRENTFRVEFGNVPKKPSSEEVHNFVGRHLGVTREQLVKIQLHHIDDCAYVKVTDLAVAQKVVSDHDNNHSYEVKGVKYRLRIRMADGGVEVRLHDLSENITNEQVSRHLSAYGEIISIQDLRWSDKHHFAGLSSGVRQVKMVLREHIKSYITIEGETTYVTYPKQRQTCRHCTEYMHIGISCVQNKKLLAQRLSLNDRLKPKTYARALGGPPAKEPSGNLPSSTLQSESNTVQPIAGTSSPMSGLPDDQSGTGVEEDVPAPLRTRLEISPSPPSTERDVSRSPIRPITTTTDMKKTESGAAGEAALGQAPVPKSTTTTTTSPSSGFSSTPSVLLMDVSQEGDGKGKASVSSLADSFSGFQPVAQTKVSSDGFLVPKGPEGKGMTRASSETALDDLPAEGSKTDKDEFIEVKKRGRKPRSQTRKN